MPERAKGPRLWFRRARRSSDGRITHAGIWLIRDDGGYSESTRCGLDDRRGAEQALSNYIARKQVIQAATGKRDAASVAVADVVALYLNEVAAKCARPKEAAGRAKKLLAFFGDKRLSDVNGILCRAYVAQRPTDAAARRELEDLRAAINYHRKEGLCTDVVEIVLPDEHAPRERWLTRSEAAKLLLCAWRYREIQKGVATDRRSRRHVARFILVGLYTGTRASAICGAALQPTEGRGWIDLERGVFYRRPMGRRETKKRQPAIPLPAALLSHLRRWKRNGQRFVIEWNAQPVRAIEKAFAGAVADAKLGPDVTPHVLRHTAITWAAQEGVPEHEICGYYGITRQIFEEVYAHHHPDHLSKARDALGKRKRHNQAVARHKMKATESEQRASNVAKIR